MRRRTAVRGDSGQSMIETLLMLPIMLLVLFNAINFGYFFLITLNLSTATRSGVEYAMLGGRTPGDNGLVKPTEAANATYQDIFGAIGSPYGAAVKICTKQLGYAAGVANCATCTGAQTGSTCTGNAAGNAADVDNEGASPRNFVLQRVDITYTFSPLLPPALFNLTVLAIPSCTSTGGNVSCVFHRHVSMRAMD
jgi:Flp pilus assembly protein TadG